MPALAGRLREQPSYVADVQVEQRSGPLDRHVVSEQDPDRFGELNARGVQRALRLDADFQRDQGIGGRLFDPPIRLIALPVQLTPALTRPGQRQRLPTRVPHTHHHSHSRRQDPDARLHLRHDQPPNRILERPSTTRTPTPM